MTGRTWTRDEIRAFVVGSEVQFLSTAAHMLDVPDWALEPSEGTWAVDVSEGFERAHPDDHQRLLTWWIDVAERPAVVVEATIRFVYDDIWFVRRLRAVNLSDQPGIAAVVACSAYVGLAPLSDPGAMTPTPQPEALVDWLIARLDRVSHIDHVEGSVQAMLGREPADVLGRSSAEFMRPEDAISVVPFWLRIVGTPGATGSSRRCFVHPDGTEVWAECTYLNRFDAAGKGDVLMVAYDISARRAQEQALAESNDEIRRLGDEARRLADESQMLARHFRLLADRVPAAVFRCDASGLLMFGNGRWADLLPQGTMAAGVAGQRVHDAVAPEDRPLVDDLFAGLTTAGGPRTGVVEVRSADGYRVLRLQCRSVRDGAAGHDRFVGSIDDISATVRLRDEARRDPLTGVLNRAAFEEDLTARLAVDPVGTLVIFVDLDGFKGVNDDHGHDAGDIVLVEVARRLVGGARPEHSVGRYGGDEFVLACRITDDADATAVADRIAYALGGPVGFPGGSWAASASAGSVLAGPGDTAADVLHRADVAMFDVKRTRTNARVAK